MELDRKILDKIDAWQEEHLQLLMTLAQIPAPSGQEEARAQFCKDWLDRNGADGVYIDDALNVIYPIGITENAPLMVFAAHSDVVFPDRTPLPLQVKDGKIFCPGVGDDTACVAALMMAAKYIAQHHLCPKDCGVLLVIDSSEEGLGNLNGVRTLFRDFGDRIQSFVTFDGRECRCVHQAVGSKRYRIAIDTEGGHSYGDFGNRNAIAHLASLIDSLYAIEVPPYGKTTYNVGTIIGGTSVNTIAQHAEMLYEFRSDHRASLTLMETRFDQTIKAYRDQGLRVSVTLVGERPCSAELDPDRMRALTARASEATQRHYGRELLFESGSTDCNIPLSMGISAICVGCYDGGGAHTREEYVKIDSLLPGLRFTFDMILHHF